jgi:vacuolar-type H+-ATPase subunit E/Vma4
MTLDFLDEGRSLELFKKALQEEYEKRLEALRKEHEERLMELTAQYRQRTEIEVSRIRQALQARYEETLRTRKESVKGELISLIYKELSDLYSETLSYIEKELFSFTSNPEGGYKGVLKGLVEEALAVLNEPAVVVVRPEDENLLLEHPLVEKVEVEEDDKLLNCGGCIVLDAATKRRIVDNTILSRFEKLKGMIREKLSIRYKEVFDVVEKI